MEGVFYGREISGVGVLWLGEEQTGDSEARR
jgi:hypothetical protein